MTKKEAIEREARDRLWMIQSGLPHTSLPPRKEVEAKMRAMTKQRKQAETDSGEWDYLGGRAED